MYGIGMQEFIVIFILLFILGLPIAISLLLRSKYPNNLAVGMILSFLFVPFGQLYLKRGAPYIISLVFIGIALYFISPNGKIAGLLITAISMGVMYFRFKKIET